MFLRVLYFLANSRKKIRQQSEKKKTGTFRSEGEVSKGGNEKTGRIKQGMTV